MGKTLLIKKDIPSLQEAIDEFILIKSAEGISPRTIKDYHTHINLFFNAFPDCWLKDMKKSVLLYMSKECAPNYYNLKRQYLLSFFEYLRLEGYLAENPLAKIKKRKSQVRINVLENQDITMLLNTPDQKTFAGFRDYTFMLLMLDTGIRPKEALSLLITDFNFTSLTVTVRSAVSKTRTKRELPLSPIVINSINKLIKARLKNWPKNLFVFCSENGKPLESYYMGNRFEYYSKKIGVNISPYDLRHQFALQFLRNGASAFHLQMMLGHTTLNTTKIYVNLTQEDIAEKHLESSPLMQFIPSNRKRTLT